MTEIKQPKIRFKGHINDWEQRKLGEHANILAGGTPKTQIKEYWEPKEIPWMSSGEINKKRLYETDNKISEKGLNNSNTRWVKENSVLIALAGQGKTRGTVAVNEIKLTTNQSIAAIETGNELNYEFLFQHLEKRYDELRLLSSGDGSRGGLNKKIISDLFILSPSIHEQQKIGIFFKVLDTTIALHQQKLEVTKQFKQTMLKKMFPKNGETTPEIRFKGFTEDWEYNKFLNIFNKYSEKNINSFEQYTIGKKGVKKIEKDILYNVENHKLFKPNSLILGLGIEEMGVSEDIFGSCSPIYTTYSIKQANTLFIKYFINGFLNINKNKVTKTSTRREFEIVIRDVEKLNLSLPNIQEQELIGIYFKELDNQIKDLEKKLETYKEFKKAMLQKMLI